MKPLSARQQQVLQATVHHYVDTMEPVGSRTLVQRFGIPASSATVRSAMGALEKRGLLTQPHTSAGRIPSALGYRRYVDDLLPKPGVAVQYLERELTGLSLRWAALDDLLQQPQSEMEAAHARMADHHHRSAIRQLLWYGLQPGVGTAQRPMQHVRREAGQIQFRVLPNVHQQGIGAVVLQPGLQIPGLNRSWGERFHGAILR